MLRISILLTALAASCCAQNAEELFNRPPAGVDETLRARITEFYGYHISREYRKAEALVAEDTKDYFYAGNKPPYLHCEILRIAYSANFTRAKATITCGMYVMVPGFADKPFNVPLGSTWKIEDGKWMWYVDEDQRRASPMGKMTPGPPVFTAQGAAPKPLPQIPTSADFLYSLVKVEKRDVDLKRGESAQLTISNTAPGVMNLALVGKVAGVEATLDNPSLKANEKAILTLKAGENAESGSLQISVMPIEQLIPIRVTVAK